MRSPFNAIGKTVGSDTPLFSFNDNRQDLVREVSSRVYNDHLTRARRNPNESLEHFLNETAIQEIERQKNYRGPEEEVRDMAWWRGMARRLGTMSEPEKRSILRALIDSYVDDTAGKFNPQVFKFATGALPVGLGFLFKTQDLDTAGEALRHMRTGWRELRDLSQRVVVEGEVDTVRKLSKTGTVIVVPTHSSNMDSMLLGWSLESVGLPPVTYGAGKNLFHNPLIGFFMHNLGAYKVDRRLRHTLYKNVLKSYSQVLVERGFHSLFFPGGTRCRSNHVDHQLKLGLLGTSVSAYIHNLQQGRDNRIYICPATINYNLVLEAESLIREHLKREGGNRYFLDDDEFNQVSTVARFVMNTVSMNSTTVIRYGKPFDPFGNHVEADGESYDVHGRRVDPKTYVQSISTGDFVEDRERDFAYTRFTGEKIAESFLENTVLQPASIVAYAMFEILAARYPKIDVYELLRFATNERIAWTEVAPVVRATVDQLRALEKRGAVRLTEHARNLEELIDEGVDALTAFHVPAVIEPQGSGLLASRLDVLYFYGNRVRSYDVDVRDAVAEGGRP